MVYGLFMTNKIVKKAIVFFLLIVQALYYGVIPTFAQDTDPDTENIQDVADLDPDVTQENTPSDPSPTPYDPNLPAEENISAGFDSVATASQAEIAEQSSPSAKASEKFPSDKIVLNPVDRRKLEQMETLANALPDFYDETNMAELAFLSGTSEDQLKGIKTSDPNKFSQIITDADQKTHNNSYLMNKIKKDPVILSELFNSTTDEMVYELQNDPSGVEKAIQRVMDTQIDKRVIKTLIYLVTPKDQGGAGHWRIKVERITKNYDKEPSKFEREDKAIKEEITLAENKNLSNSTVEQIKADQNTTASEEEVRLGDQATAVVDIVNRQGGTTATAYIGNKTDEDDNTVSSHFTGQAVDISEVDDLKCTTVGYKRIGKSSKTAQAPRPIKLKWQTKEGYAEDKETIDSSYNSMFLNASQDSILEMLSQLNFDFASLGDMRGADFSQMAGVLAQAFLANAINSPDGNIWKFNLSDTLRNLGGVILADELDLNRMPFLDPSINSVDALSQAIGRSYIEENLNLPYGALKGTSRDELLANIGRQRILSELELPSDILNNEIIDSTDLYQRIGSRIVESEFGFPTGSFYTKSNYSDLSKAAGRYKLDALHNVASGADEYLGLPAGTFARLASGAISPTDFNRLVAEAHFAAFVQLYGNSYDTSGTNAYPTIDLPSGRVSNLRDEVFNLPNGKIDRFLNGELTINDYKEIGIYSVSSILETNDTGRSRISGWLNNPNQDMTVSAVVPDPNNPDQEITQTVTLPSLDYAGVMGVEGQDFYRIFGSADQASGVFKRLGQEILTEAVRDSDFVTRQTQELLRQNPQAQEVLDLYDFYKTRIDNIKSHSAALKTHSEKLTTQIAAIETGVLDETIKSQTSQALAQLVIASSHTEGLDSLASFVAIGGEISNSSAGASAILTQLSQIVVGNTNVAIQNLTYEMNATTFEAEVIAKNAYEIITGKEQPNFRYGDLQISDLQIPDLTFGSTTFGSSDILMLLSGKITPREFLISLGSAKLAGELNLPRWSLKYMASVVEALTGSDTANIKDAFFRALGISVMEDQANLNSGSLASSDTLGKPISISELRQIVKARQGGSQITADAVLAEALNLKGYNLSSLMRGDFAAWSLARAKSEEFDHKNGLATGTTEKFIKGEPLNQIDRAVISDDELRNTATKMNVSEASLKTFISKRDGIENAMVNKVYYVDQNQYSAFSGIVSNDVCQERQIPAGSYVYYDQDGLHTFNSASLANDYRKNYANKEIDYLDEIANALRAENTSVNLGDVKSNLEGFLNSDDAKSFGDANFSALASEMENNFDIPKAVFTKVFARSTESGQVDQSAQIDYLKILGYHVAKEAAVDFLNDYLGVSFGSTRITPDDLYEILSGNGLETFARIGGALLDREMDLDRGTIETILTSKSDAERECALRGAALDLVGNLLGSREMKLAGSLINSFGGGKIETTLGFPKGSFRGANLDELINNVLIENFVKGFNIPISKDINDKFNTMLQKIDLDLYSANKNVPPETKLSVISSQVYAKGQDGLINKELFDMFGATKGDLKQQALAYLADPGKVDEIQANSLSVDGLLGISAGTTSSLLLSSISPNQYRDRVNGATLTDGLGNYLIAILGLEDTGITVDRVNQFMGAVRDIGGSDILSSGNTNSRVTIYNFLNDLFSINLDKKAGFQDGTFAQIIEQPGRARELLIQTGIRKIDSSLGIEGEVYSLENIYALFTNISIDDVMMGDGPICDNPLVTSFTECINSRRIVGTDFLRQDLANRAANRIASWINDITGVTVTIESPTRQPITANAYGITMPASDILGISRGDYRSILLIGMVKGAGAIIGDENGRLAVGSQFVLSYQDYYTALFGDPALEDYARARAYASTYADFNGTNSQPAGVDQAGIANIAAPPNAPSGVINTPIPQSVADETRTDINSNFPVADGANTAMPSVPGPMPDGSTIEEGSPEYDIYLTALVDWTNQNAQWQSAVNSARTAGEEAARSVRTIYKQNLQYKTMDASLYKLDNNIPAGFSRMMLNGNTYVKTTAMLNYIENWIRNDVGWASNLPPGTFSALQNFFISSDPGIRGNTDTLINDIGVASFSAIDSFLVANSPAVMGLSLQPGTAEGLFSYVMTKDTGAGYAGLKSIKDIYGESFVTGTVSRWADDTLNLPAGTTYGLYNSLKTIQSAQNALRTAELAQNASDIINAKTDLANAKADAIAFAINMVFSKQVGQMESSLGLVPGSGAMLVTMLTQLALSVPVNPITLGIFIAMNLFMVYKQVVICSADGSYPKMEDPPDPTKWDVAGLGEFNALNEKARDNGYIAAAQYKAGQLVFDLLSMKDRTGDKEQVPVQIMTGRVEDVGPNIALVEKNICDKVGSSSVQENTGVCAGWRSRSGLWANPQTISWTHVGF